MLDSLCPLKFGLCSLEINALFPCSLNPWVALIYGSRREKILFLLSVNNKGVGHSLRIRLFCFLESTCFIKVSMILGLCFQIFLSQILMTDFYVPFLNKQSTLLIVCVSLVVYGLMSFKSMIMALLCHVHLFDGSIHCTRIRYYQQVINIYFVLKAIQLLIKF